jgi:uncharacterized protein YaeQ
MALPPTIHRLSIDLADSDRDRYGRLQATVARHPSETAERLLARVLAYALSHEEGLEFTKGVGAGDEPDLWLKGPDGRVRLWIEVGLPDAERLLKAGRHAGKVILFAFGSGRPRWESAHLPRLAATGNIDVYGLDLRFLQQLAERLERAIDWSLAVSGGTLYLTVAGTTLESPVAHLAGAAIA